MEGVLKMDTQKMKKIFILGIIALILILILAIVIGNMRNSGMQSNSNRNNSENTVNERKFTDTVDLDMMEKRVPVNDFGTENQSLGTLNDYYDNTESFTKDNKLYVRSFEGYDIIALEWLNESYGTYVSEPAFGSLKKFILTSSYALAMYENVKMRDVTTYVDTLTKSGYTAVQQDNRNNREDYYIYTVISQSGDRGVGLNYEKGELSIEMYDIEE